GALHTDGSLKCLTQRLMVGKYPGVEFFDRNSERSRQGEPISFLCFLELRDTLGIAICVGHENYGLELFPRRVPQGLERQLEMPAALARTGVAARQIADVEPLVSRFRRQYPLDQTSQRLRSLVVGVSFVGPFGDQKNAHS